MYGYLAVMMLMFAYVIFMCVLIIGIVGQSQHEKDLLNAQLIELQAVVEHTRWCK